MTAREASRSEIALRARAAGGLARAAGERIGQLLGPLALAFRPLGRALAPIAPHVSEGLWLALRVPLSLLAASVDLVRGTGHILAADAAGIAAGAMQRLSVAVTPVRAVAGVCAAAALALAASQFTDYSGVAVGAASYSGEVETVAPAPQTALETAGSAHLYVLLPLAALALALTWMTARGRWRLGRAIAAVGLVGILVSLAIDLPQGLDAGRAGDGYLGTDARLIEGFWAQLAASVALIGLGPLLGLYARRAQAGARTAPRAGARAGGRRRLLGRRLRSPRPRRGRSAAGRAEART